jgi:hypothetical protein
MAKSNHCGDCVNHAPANPQKFPKAYLHNLRSAEEALRKQRQLKRLEAAKTAQPEK